MILQHLNPMQVLPATRQADKVRATASTAFGVQAFPAVVPLFGAGDQFQSSRKSPLLLPAGTPVFFLHGTSSTATRLNPLVHWFKHEVRSEHPGYVSYLPEVEEATGIERVNNPKTTVPASLAAARELADFRYQVVFNQLKAVTRQWEALQTDDQAVARLFHLRPDEADELVPLIRQHVLSAIHQAPAGQAQSQPLMELVRTRLQKLEEELLKLTLRHDEINMPIYDTRFLHAKATLEGKQVNFRMGKEIHEPNVINMRRITLEDGVLLENYLLTMQTGLAADIATTWQSRAKQAGQALDPARNQARAEATAARLMDVVAPQGLVIGHSQGGTVLLTTLLKALDQQTALMTTQQDKPISAQPKSSPALPGRSVGMALLLSAPVKGLPEVPLWGKVLLSEVDNFQRKVPLLKRWDGSMSRALKRLLWFAKTFRTPAIEEMRAGSDLTQKNTAGLQRLTDNGVTVISAYDRHDSYVEPEASLLEDAQGRQPANVFNIEFETDQLPPSWPNPDELFQQFLSDNPLLRRMMDRVMPADWKQKAYQFYREKMIQVEQHQAMIVYPDHMGRELGRKLLDSPQQQIRTLDTQNFAPFRYQSLVARGKSLQKYCLSLPTPQAAAVLAQFHHEHPRFLSVVIDNVREDIPLTNAPSEQARQILEQTLGLLERMVQSPSLSKAYRQLLGENLAQIQQADLPRLSERAGRLLSRISAA